jgi:hypothetical protein
MAGSVAGHDAESAGHDAESMVAGHDAETMMAGHDAESLVTTGQHLIPLVSDCDQPDQIFLQHGAGEFPAHARAGIETDPIVGPRHGGT